MLNLLKGYIFDLDGTLFDSKLDFDQMRLDLNFPKGASILEHLESILDETEKKKCQEIIHQHEMTGANIAKPFPFVLELLELLNQKNIPHAIITRNSKKPTSYLLKKYQLDHIYTITREDFVPKPDPSSLLHVQEKWKLPHSELCYIGDFLHDLEAAKNAGMKAILYRNHKNDIYEEYADYVLKDFSEIIKAL